MRADLNDHVREVRRIRAAYARRAQRGDDARYTLFEPAHLFQSQSLERALLRALRREGYRSLDGLRILDAGCGSGAWLDGLRRYGAQAGNLYGVELREEVFRRDGHDVTRIVAAGGLLPFPAASFDLVCQVTMLSSILDAETRRQTASELLRVLRPSGFILWYDFTVNPLNPDTHGIGRAELRCLFAGARIRAERVTLAAPLTRLLAPRAWTACLLLEQFPWLRTHLLATIRRPTSPPRSER
jgi:SAM-dependent methyltransferase